MLEGHSGGISSVSLSQDGKTVASGSSDKTVRIWNAEIGEVVKLINDNCPVMSVICKII